MIFRVYENPPADFVSQVSVAACYLEVEQRILLLQSASHKPEPGKWGVPAGKLEIGETPEQAAKRELFEETGIEGMSISDLGVLYMRKFDIDYVYHLFKVGLDEMKLVSLSDEHEGFIWASKNDLASLPLMTGALEGIEFYQKKGIFL